MKLFKKKIRKREGLRGLVKGTSDKPRLSVFHLINIFMLK